ncbi:polysaccharide deacetylase family protein [Streptomyces sp. NPDC093546]|uniref:polysaccharide deacetylase family protein n=1 Tax=Streptomyces sp. NPDC093546 TaxID=3366040 RepID=UPI00381BDFF7
MVQAQGRAAAGRRGRYDNAWSVRRTRFSLPPPARGSRHPCSPSRPPRPCRPGPRLCDAAWNDVGLDRVLGELARRRTPAAFFLTGEFADRNPQVVRRIAAAGHGLGNHSYSHPFFKDLTALPAVSPDRTRCPPGRPSR